MFQNIETGWVMSNVINYRGHWSFFDNSISVNNYLQYSDKEWRNFNPSILYQNRMRHTDYIKIISETSFEILEEKLNYPDEKELEMHKKIKLTGHFLTNYTSKDLSIKSSLLVLRKKPRSIHHIYPNF